MSTSLPPVPKKDSAGRRVAVVVVLVACAVLGFLAWKALQKPAPEPSPPPKPAAVAPKAPVLEPPPPPPEEAAPPPPVEAKPEPAKPSAPRKDTCDGECKGTETSELLSALRARAGQARSCYERALTHNSSLSGSVVLNLRVSPTGTACSASMGKDTLGDPAVTNCVLQRFRSGKFPKPTGGCVDIALPINFVPAQR